MVMSNVISQFACGLVLIFGFAIFYVLWDNSCKKFDEAINKMDDCMDHLSGRMLITEKLLEKYNITEEDKKTFKELIEYRRIYECHLITLKECLKRP